MIWVGIFGLFLASACSEAPAEDAIVLTGIEYHYHSELGNIVRESIREVVDENEKNKMKAWKEAKVVGNLKTDKGIVSFVTTTREIMIPGTRVLGSFEAAKSYASLLSEDHTPEEQEMGRVGLKRLTGLEFESKEDLEKWFETYKKYFRDTLYIPTLAPERYWAGIASGYFKDVAVDEKDRIIVADTYGVHGARYFFVNKNEIKKPGMRVKGYIRQSKVCGEMLSNKKYPKVPVEGRECLKRLTGVEFKSKEDWDKWLQENRKQLRYSEKLGQLVVIK